MTDHLNGVSPELHWIGEPCPRAPQGRRSVIRDYQAVAAWLEDPDEREFPNVWAGVPAWPLYALLVLLLAVAVLDAVCHPARTVKG